MKWVKLIGGRFLDFLITGALVALLCIGVLLIGEHYGRIKPLPPERMAELEAKYLRPLESRQPEVGRARGQKIDWDRRIQEAEAFRRKYAPVEPPRAIRNVTRVLSIAIGLFGVISVLGIVFRREGLTQREGFVRVWVGVPKYLGKYFAGYFRKSNTGGE